MLSWHRNRVKIHYGSRNGMQTITLLNSVQDKKFGRNAICHDLFLNHFSIEINDDV